MAYGVPADAIVVENASATTRENALYAKPLLARQDGRIVLLTSDYHMFRAWRCFQKLGIPVISRPFPDLLKRSNQLPKRWEGFLILSGELASIGYYRIRGWI